MPFGSELEANDYKKTIQRAKQIKKNTYVMMNSFFCSSKRSLDLAHVLFVQNSYYLLQKNVHYSLRMFQIH